MENQVEERSRYVSIDDVLVFSRDSEGFLDVAMVGHPDIRCRFGQRYRILFEHPLSYRIATNGNGNGNGSGSHSTHVAVAGNVAHLTLDDDDGSLVFVFVDGPYVRFEDLILSEPIRARKIGFADVP